MAPLSPDLQTLIGVGVACLIIAVLSASVSYLTYNAISAVRKVLP